MTTTSAVARTGGASAERVARAWSDTGYLSSMLPSSGTVPPRAHADTSARSVSLDGEWAFRWSPTVTADAVTSVDAATDVTGWPRISVPAHWALEGWGSPWYTNLYYPFPLDPPFTPEENETGVYVRDFDGIGWDDSRVVLRFDGIEAIAQVWLNDRLLGVTRGSRLQQEFDVTEVLTAGANRLVVRVHQWAATSYLEDQDMWWLPGIFRSVSLRERPLDGIADLFAHAEYDHRTGRGTFRIDAATDDGTIARVIVEELGIDGKAGETFDVAVEPWSAESPRLYTASLSTPGETVRLRIGFRSIAIVDGVFTVNGIPITLYGVNRHEFHPETGRAIDRRVMIDDIRLMKQHNVNAVRTSHYPPAPEFLSLCDELGLWVIDECDLETHGFFHDGWQRNPSADPAWREAYLDRMRRTLERDKNHPSIVLWSLGNESHTGENLRAMADWARRRDPSRPIHYESDAAGEYVDVFGRMYQSFEAVDDIGNATDLIDPDVGATDADARRRALPFLHTEYAHAMGNGPGGLADYRDRYDAYPRCMGGFVWEFIDQGLRRVREDGTEYYAYGGDFGEPIHDGTFVMDGLVFADRTPSPGLLEFKKVFEPFRLVVGDGGVHVHNRHTSIGADGFDATWMLERDGERIEEGSLELPEIAPGHSAWVAVDALTRMNTDADAVTISIRLAHRTEWADKGHEVAWVQATTPPTEQTIDDGRADAWQSVARTDPPFAIGPALFDPASGDVVAIGQTTLTRPVRVDLWRAPTSNDIAYDQAVRVAQAWRLAGLDLMRFEARSIRRTGDAVRIDGVAGPLGRAHRLVVQTTWRAIGDDRVRLEVDVQPVGAWPTTWPRLALAFAISADHGRARWFGYGPGEGYVDTRSALRLGRYDASIADLQTPYAVPQENGARPDVRCLDLVGSLDTLRIAPRTPLGFTARPWSTAQLDAAGHPYDLTPGDEVFVTLDVATDGIGSASCGPPPLAKDRLTPSDAHIVVEFSMIAPPHSPDTAVREGAK